MVRAVPLGRVADHLVATALVEVHVDVRHRPAGGVEEPLEDQAVAQRVEVGDPQAVRHHGARRRAAARAHADAALAREPDQVPDDQEVSGEPHLGDDAELVVDAPADVVRERRVSGRRAFVDQLAEIALQVLAVRRLEPRQVEPLIGRRAVPVHQVELHPLGDEQRVVAGLRQFVEDPSHLLRALQVELLRVELQPLRVALELLLLDAEQHVVRLRILLDRVVEVVRRDERDAERPGERDLLGQDAALVGDAVVLQLHEEAVRAEDVAVLTGRLLGTPVLAGEQHRRQLARQAARQADDALRVLGEQILVHPRPVVEPLQVGRGHQLQQVPVPRLVLGEEREVVVLLLVLAGVPLEPRARRHVGFDPDDRLDPGGATALEEPERPEHRPVIGHRNRRHAVARGLGEDGRRVRMELRGLDTRGAVEQ